jgi:UDP-glucose 4-epimerase
MWILGRGGFFGSSLALEAAKHRYSLFPQIAIPWKSPAQRLLALEKAAEEFRILIATAHNPPTIVWAAGSEGVRASQSQEVSEYEAFLDFVAAISGVEALHGASVVVVSSAGGVLGGSPSPPFNVRSPVRAINQYGFNKIAIEEVALRELSSKFQVHIARITNLYGPWPGPRQGLINRMCTAAATREAMQIYVPLETVRDYIYITDAAKLLLLEIDTVGNHVGPDSPGISLIGSGENSSVGTVIDVVSHVARRKIPITMAQLEATALQPRDLRIDPSWIERGIEFEPLSLAQGVKKLFDSLVTVPRWN